ncbi:polyphosphate polymerase domain-containing protein [Butyrivibrio sp. MC2013]|uniref:polyphosphate polymerase domain-containing protein n=1 Tax=Butyrivibrio sp. MC2013 TaxID=1280686 RepID=UPI0018C989EF|nr:polyphosphate polymerase domain-containing protein [Butyrivibrio sp. MC2013]
MTGKVNQFRHELKYLINEPEMAAIMARLRGFMTLDPNASEDGYMIRSLYFDDVWNSAYEEKYMGIYARRKYRIRIYNCSDKGIKLERKKKEGNYIFKESASLTRAETEAILDGEYDFLLEKDNKLLKEFYYECVSNFLRPRTIVDYDRIPFIMDEGTVRVTFDRDVRAAVLSYDIFDPELPTMGVLDSGYLVMEVKYTEFLPQLIRDLLPPKSREMVAVSKYVLCCDKTQYLFNESYYGGSV